MNAKELVEAMKQATESGYHVFGIRTIENPAGVLNVGDSVPDSYDWDYENDISTRETTGETLPGACAIQIFSDDLWLDGTDDDETEAAICDAVKKSSVYYGEQVLLIAGKGRYLYGSDLDEIIIADADVIGVVK